MARVRGSSRATAYRSKSTSTRKKVEKQPVDIAAIRAELGDFQKELRTKITESDIIRLINGTPEQIVENVNLFAATYNLEPGTFSIGKRSFSSGSGYHRYTSTHWAIVGTRPYTDEELAKDGVRLIAQKKRKDAAHEEKRKKDLAKLNLLAGQLGVKVVTPAKPRVSKASGSTYKSGDPSATNGTTIRKGLDDLSDRAVSRTRKQLISDAKRLGIKGADRMGKTAITEAIALRTHKSKLR